MRESAAAHQSLVQRIVLYLAVVFFLLFTLFPIYWLANSAFKGPTELFDYPPSYLPQSPTLQNFITALTQTRLGLLYVNSILTAVLTCAILMVLIIFGGFALARFPIRGRTLVIALFLLAQVIPQVVLLLPVFTMFQVLGLVDTRLGLALVYVATLLPFSVMTMRSFFAAIPVELEEAAMIDGCSRTGALFRVVLPAVLPGLVATTIYGFINAWNELLFAIILISTPNLQTLPVGLMSMTDERGTDYGLMLAVALLALLPSLALFGWIQRYLVTGLSAGAVKG